MRICRYKGYISTVKPLQAAYQCNQLQHLEVVNLGDLTVCGQPIERCGQQKFKYLMRELDKILNERNRQQRDAQQKQILNYN